MSRFLWFTVYRTAHIRTLNY